MNLDDLKNDALKFCNLKPNWDSYGASPIPKIIVDKTLELLSSIAGTDCLQPVLIPTPDGGIDIE